MSSFNSSLSASKFQLPFSLRRFKATQTKSAFRGGEMVGADARYVGQAEKLGRLDTHHTVEHGVSLIDENRIAKAQTADCGGDVA